MSKKFFSSLFLLVLLNVLVKPVWIFGIDRQVQNTVGTEVYGQYFALFNLACIFNFFLDAGLSTAWNRRAAHDPDWLQQQYGATATLKLLMGLLYGGLLGLAGMLMGTGHPVWLLLLGLNQFLFSFLIFLRNSLTALQWFTADAWVSVADKLLALAACGTMLLFPGSFGRISIESFAGIQTLSILLVIMVLLLLLRQKANLLFAVRRVFDKQLFVAALPFGMIVLLMTTHNRADGFLLTRLHHNGACEAGTYAAAYRLLDAGNMVGFLVAGFLLPFIARHCNDGVLVRKTAARSALLLLGFAIPATVVTSVFAMECQGLLYKQADPYGASVLRWSMAALSAYCLTQVYGTVLTALGHTRLFIRICFVAVMVNLLCNGLLMPVWGAKGAAIAALVSQSGFAICLWIAAHKKMRSLPS